MSRRLRLSDGPRRLDEAAQARVQSHLHLIDLLARQQFSHCARTVPLEELVGEAGFALVYAASVYDAGKEVPFGAYATMVIRHRLVQAVTSWRRHGRLAHVRFTDLAAPDDKGRPTAFDPACPQTQESYQEAATRELLGRVRRVLPRRWFDMLELYYACNHSLEEIGERLGLSRQRVQQLINKALVRARRYCPE